jgi:indole-3-glycerol phosphate synthase
MNILHKIVADRKNDLISLKETKPISFLEKSTFFSRSPISITKKIRLNNGPSIIAEYKRRSPSKPAINLNADIETVPKGYEQAGAMAISILTNEHYFGGSTEDILLTRPKVNIPILRKEFIIDEYQIIEAKAMGADFILLIAEVLTADEVKDLTATAHNLGMEVLLEMHSESQLSKIHHTVDLIGINNRNLENFHTTIDTSMQLLSKLPQEKIKVSESGIDQKNEVLELYKAGYEAYLIGESFMKNAVPGESCAVFIDQINKEIAL